MREVPVDTKTLALLTAVSKAAEVLQIPWLVTGAAGRVLLLEGVYGLPRGRATQDVDLGVMVGSWQQYQALVDQLRQDPRFRSDPQQRQRMLFQDSGLVDLVPFGDIESHDRTIVWPPDDGVVMNVVGFREAYRDAVIVSVEGLRVPVVSAVGLMLLKLAAWKERHYIQPRKDAADIAYLISHYDALLTQKVLFDAHMEDITAAEYDLQLAACHVMGRKMGALVARDTWEYLNQFMTEELSSGADSRLVRDVAEALAGAEDERGYQLLKNLWDGFVKAQAP
jgi:predicted nucleotidyltransferase